MNKKLAILLILLAVGMVLFAADGDQTSTLVSYNDRSAEPIVRPVWEQVITYDFDADDTTNVTQSIPINGILMKVIFVTPDATTGRTYQVEIDDNADIEIFDSGEKAEATTYTYNLFEPISGTIDITVGPSGTMGATNPDILVYLRGI